jgi:hypothetical protein
VTHQHTPTNSVAGAGYSIVSTGIVGDGRSIPAVAGARTSRRCRICALRRYYEGKTGRPGGEPPATRAWQMQPWDLTERSLCAATHHQLEHKAEYMTMRPCSTIFRLVDWATGGLAFHVKLSNVDTSRWGPSASVAAQHHLVRQAVVSSKHRLHT